MTLPGSYGAAGESAGGPPPGPPRCYRHTDRETWVRCTRCDRPICPDCMNSAAVGFQCPECVREGNRTLRAPQTVAGAPVAGRPGQVTMLLIALNVLAFGYELSAGTGEVERRFGLLGRATYYFGGAEHGVAAGEWYRLLTSAFLHASLLHIAFNMYALYVVGPQLEAVLGRARFLAVYLVSALGGSTLAYLVAPQASLGVGASGAIFGLFAGLFVIARRLDLDVRPIAALIGINLVITFVVPQISWQAHVGGLVTGGVLCAAMVYAPRGSRRLAGVLAPGVVVVLCLVAVVARTSALTG